MNKKNIYFASPWFNPEQEEREERLKAKLREIGFEVWSPKESCICPPNASTEIKKQTFDDNCANIFSTDIVFAVTDGKDMGTIWEAGYANGLNVGFTDDAKIKIVYYCETLNGGQFNLMLAQSGDVVITDFKDLDNLEKLLKEGQAYVGSIE